MPDPAHRTAPSISFDEDDVAEAAQFLMAQSVLPGFLKWKAPVMIAALVRLAAMGALSMPAGGWSREEFIAMAGRAYDFAMRIERLAAALTGDKSS